MEQPFDKAYYSPEKSKEYWERHRKSAVRRMVSRREVRLISRWLRGLPRGSQILDMACGNGRISSHLRSKGWVTIGADVSLDMLRLGSQVGHLESNAVVNASIFNLPFGNNTLDGSVCARFFHHLPEQSQRIAALNELNRVVKGPIVISLWTGHNLQSMRRGIKRALGRRPSSRFTIRLASFEQELAMSGLERRKISFLFPLISETVYLCLQRAAPNSGDTS